MGGFSLWHWIIAILAFSTIVPVIKTLNKAGYSGFWVILSLIPIVNFVALWVFAYADWPALHREEVPGKDRRFFE